MLAIDNAAFDRFFNENFARLYRFAIARLSDNPGGTREVVQIALAKGIRNLQSSRGESALFTWLCAICRNEMSDWLRQKGRRQEHILLTEDFPEIQAAVESFRAPQSDSPEQSYRRTDLIRLIQVALDRLLPDWQIAAYWPLA